MGGVEEAEIGQVISSQDLATCHRAMRQEKPRMSCYCCDALAVKCCEVKLLPSVFFPVAPTLPLEPPRSKDRKARETLVTGFPAALSALA